VARIVGGTTPSTKEPSYWEGGTLHWATPKDLSSLASPVLLDTERRITEAGLQQISSGLLPKGTVLLSSRAPIGYLAVAHIPVAINQGFIAMICDEAMPSYYLLQWVQQNMDEIISRANGTTFLEVSKKNFRPLPIIVPPSELLRRYAKQMDAVYQKIVNNLEQSRTLAALRDTLLPRLLSGAVAVGTEGVV
jgi:type I restriction enzyme S subunit